MTQTQRLWVFLGVFGFGLLLYLLEPILAPFLVAALIAYLGDPAADYLEEKGLGRTSASVIVFSAISLVVIVLLLLWVPSLVKQAQAAAKAVPEILDWIDREGIPRLESISGVDIETIDLAYIQSVVAEHWFQSKDLLAGVIKSVTQSSLGVFAFLGNLALVPVVAFYLLRDWDRLNAKILALMPARYRKTTLKLALESDEVLGAFIKGQFIVMLSLAMIYAFGLWIVGLELALLVGLIAGLASIVPYLGVLVGIVASTVAAVMQFGWGWELVLVWGVFGIGQVLEGTVLTPLLVGDKIGLHPVAVIFAILAGGQLFGFVGILIALPVAAVIMVFLRHVHDHYTGSEFYKHVDQDVDENTKQLDKTDQQ